VTYLGKLTSDDQTHGFGLRPLPTYWSDLSQMAEGRMTLVTGTPVTTTDQIGAGTVYYTNYLGDRLSLWDGVRWKPVQFSEASLALSGLGAGSNYDVFGYDSGGGVLALELSAAWSSDTARADALTKKDGVRLKASNLTRRLLGTFRATAAATTEDSIAKRFLSNEENLLLRPLQVLESTDTWTQSVANTWRSANGSTANRVEVVRCSDDLPVRLDVLALMANNQNGSNNAVVSIGLDSTTVQTAAKIRGSVGNRTAVGSANNHKHAATCQMVIYSGIGYHFFQWLEFTSSAGGMLWYGDDGGTNQQTGMLGEVWG